MSVTAEAVRQLRERTGAGMMECKKALVETSGDLDAAAELMRKQGLAKADKKAARIAAEGVIVIERSADGHVAADGRDQLRDRFRRARAGFPQFRSRRGATDAGRQAGRRRGTAGRGARGGESVDARRRALVAKIGENISVRRTVVLETNGRTGCLSCMARASACWWHSRAARLRWHTIWPCTWRPAIRAISASRRCPRRSLPRSAKS